MKSLVQLLFLLMLLYSCEVYGLVKTKEKDVALDRYAKPLISSFKSTELSSDFQGKNGPINEAHQQLTNFSEQESIQEEIMEESRQLTEKILRCHTATARGHIERCQQKRINRQKKMMNWEPKTRPKRSANKPPTPSDAKVKGEPASAIKSSVGSPGAKLSTSSSNAKPSESSSNTKSSAALPRATNAAVSPKGRQDLAALYAHSYAASPYAVRPNVASPYYGLPNMVPYYARPSLLPAVSVATSPKFSRPKVTSNSAKPYARPGIALPTFVKPSVASSYGKPSAQKYNTVTTARTVQIKKPVEQSKPESSLQKLVNSVQAKSQVCTTVAVGCGNCTMVTAESGTITSPNFPDVYGNNLNCSYSLNVPVGNVFQLSFDKFSVERDYDYVMFLDSSGVLLRPPMTGYDIPPNFVTKTNVVKVRFETDVDNIAMDNIANAHWRLNFNIRARPTAATTTTTSTTSTAESTTSTTESTTSTAESTTSTAESTTSTAESTTSTAESTTSTAESTTSTAESTTSTGAPTTSTAESTTSSTESTTETTQPTTVTPQLTTTTAIPSTTTTRTTTTPEPLVVFCTTDLTSPNCQYDLCSNLTNAGGYLESPGYDYDYPGNQNCKANISVPEGAQIKIEFLNFFVEETDILEVDSGDRVLRVANGYDIPYPIFVKSNTYDITFITDKDNSNIPGWYDGANGVWRLYFTVLYPAMVSTSTTEHDPSITTTAETPTTLQTSPAGYTTTCPGVVFTQFSDTGVVIQSPDYPNIYPPNLNCEIEVQFSRRKRVEAFFTRLYVEQDYDYIFIKDDTPRIITDVLTGYNTTAEHIILKTSSLKVIFVTDEDNVGILNNTGNLGWQMSLLWASTSTLAPVTVSSMN